ncbi:hypothetical protein [Sporomusa termitida]|uniref:Uncharacterized protein n=1 Tax=Sporomusa termitida TaxID=2377 RepID=A0A517DVN0_9FIRM|nr:hypothetical protein [Sporomusa termitida]QDR81326.1 hypothetical protein SPTER_27040 [Sporomusa termitida]
MKRTLTISSQDKPAINSVPLKANSKVCIYCRVNSAPTELMSERNEWYELAEDVKRGGQPEAAIFVEGVTERKIASMTVEEIADIIEHNNGQLMFCWR